MKRAINPFEQLLEYEQGTPVEQIVYRKICLVLLEPLFHSLSAKDCSILDHTYGVYGYEKLPADELGALPRRHNQGTKDGSEASAAEVPWKQAAALARGVPVGKQVQTRNGERKPLLALLGLVGLHSFQSKNF